MGFIAVSDDPTSSCVLGLIGSIIGLLFFLISVPGINGGFGQLKY